MKSNRKADQPSPSSWQKCLRSFCLCLGFVPLLSACDPWHREKCEWYFEPDFDRVESVEPGWVALCARNRVVNKQKCLFKARLEYAQALQGKPFRLNSVKVDDGPYPKEISSVKVCKPESD